MTYEHKSRKHLSSVILFFLFRDQNDPVGNDWIFWSGSSNHWCSQLWWIITENGCFNQRSILCYLRTPQSQLKRYNLWKVDLCQLFPNLRRVLCKEAVTKIKIQCFFTDQKIDNIRLYIINIFQKMQHNPLKKENVERICQKLSSYRQIMSPPSTLAPDGSLTCWQQSGRFSLSLSLYLSILIFYIRNNMGTHITPEVSQTWGNMFSWNRDCVSWDSDFGWRLPQETPEHEACGEMPADTQD